MLASGEFRHVQHVRPNRGPRKRGPTKGAANFCMPEIMGDSDPRVNESDEQKKVASFFPGKIGSAAPGEGPRHFFLNRPC